MIIATRSKKRGVFARLRMASQKHIGDFESQLSIRTKCARLYCLFRPNDVVEFDSVLCCCVISFM